MKQTMPLLGIVFFALCGTLLAADGGGMNPAEFGRTLGSIVGAIAGLYFLGKVLG
ncbi:MAG: hypothetical protein ACOC7K_00090 [bacterium]